MQVALLAGGNTIHAIRWANGLSAVGVNVRFITQHDIKETLAPDVDVVRLRRSGPSGYFLNALELRSVLGRLRPDVLNAHYATGYGLLARLSRFKPLMLSVWGSDVYDFPNRSLFHRWLLRGNLRAATTIGSTSEAMATETVKIFAHKNIFVTPFGVDKNVFLSSERSKSADNPIIIGTVKSLTRKYGIDTLIQAFALVDEKFGGSMDIRLEITGSGPDLGQLKALAQQLGVSEKVTFHGKVEHARVPEMLHRLDIYVALSRSESFGVAILEASACEKAVVVSDADGPAEVTVEGETGYIVPRENPEAASEALAKLINDAELRASMGRAGRAHVLKHYTWENSLELMVEAYQKTIAVHNKSMSVFP